MINLKLNVHLKNIIIGFGFLLIAIYSYLAYPSRASFYFPLLFLLLIAIITGIFEQMKYYHKHSYQTIGTLLIVIMWVVSLLQPISSGIDKQVYYVEMVSLTLLIIFVIIYAPKEWEKELNR